MHLSLLYISPSTQTPPCEVNKSGIQSHPSLALCVLPISWGPPDGTFRSARLAGVHQTSLLRRLNERSMWAACQTSDWPVSNNYFDCDSHSAFCKLQISKYFVQFPGSFKSERILFSTVENKPFPNCKTFSPAAGWTEKGNTASSEAAFVGFL